MSTGQRAFTCSFRSLSTCHSCKHEDAAAARRVFRGRPCRTTRISRTPPGPGETRAETCGQGAVHSRQPLSRLHGPRKDIVVNLDAEAPCGPHEGPLAVASKDELERAIMRICEVSEVARTLATQMLPVAESCTAFETTKTSSKRKASAEHLEIHKCSHCKKRFDTDVGLANDCKYQPGCLH